MITIKGYLVLQKIKAFLEEYITDEIIHNNGFSNNSIEKAKKHLEELQKIIDKLESE